MRGYLQVYTGTGKGKTTAALGLALRASGAGLNVYVGQFIKKGRFSEIRALEKFSCSVTVEQYGRGCFIKGKPSSADVRSARSGLSKLRDAMLNGEYDVVVADELNAAVRAGILDIEDVLQLADDRPQHVELVITGRGAHRRLLERADLVTDMRCLKHYHAAGARARKGIER